MSSVVDFHSHILPGIDDGSRSAEESVAMLQMEAAQGIQCVVATPHFYAQRDNLDRFLQKREQAAQLLQTERAQDAGLPEIHIGAEVHFFQGISASSAIGELTIDGGRHILIEMPQCPWTEAMYRELEQLYTRQDLIPIVAHVDRYIGRFRSLASLKRLAELPVLVQANAEFFLRNKTAAKALQMLEKEQIDLLGSDCHNLTTRKPNLAEAVERIQRRLGKSAIARIRSFEETVITSKSL